MPLKVFDLCCGNGHTFEGWFASEDDYRSQSERHFLICPLCANGHVERLPSAPRLNLGAVEPTAASPAQPSENAAASPAPAALQQALMHMAREIVARTEDLGADFAEEARRIHYQEAPERGIRGQASAEEIETLLAEDIAVFPLPFGSLLKEPLQ